MNDIKIDVKKMPESKVEITGEISAEEFDRAFQAAVKEKKAFLEFPGFRKGMAPEQMVIAHVGEDTLLLDAAHGALNNHWEHIVESTGLELIGSPEVSLTKIAKGNPLGFKISSSALESFHLPDYRAIAKEVLRPVVVNVTNEEIQKVFDFLKKNDNNLPPDADETRLKEAIRQNMQFEKETKERDKQRMELLEEIAKKTSLVVPRIVVEGELTKMFEELRASIAQMGLDWQAYLDHIKKTEEDLRKEWAIDAEKRSRAGLVLREIMRKEKIDPDQKLIEEKTNELLLAMSEEERKKTPRKNIMAYARGRLQHEMTFRLLEQERAL